MRSKQVVVLERDNFYGS